MDNLKSKVFSGFFWKFLERFLSQLVSFVISLVIARILDPENYGMVAIVNVFIVIANVFVTNGFDSALIQKKDPDSLDFDSMFYSSFAISVFLYLVLFFTAPLIASFYKTAELVKIVRVFSLVLPISSYNSIQNAYISKHMIFKKSFYATFISNIISGGAGILFAKLGYGVWALVYQSIIYNVLNLIIIFILIDWKPKFQFSFTRAKSLLKFGLNVFAADLIGTIYNQIYSFIIGKKYTMSDLAYYNRGQSIPYLISANIGGVISTVMYPAFSSEADSKEKIQDMLRKSNNMINYVLSPMYLGLIAVSHNLILCLLTEKWIPCVPFLIIVCVASIFSSISPLDLQALKAVGRSDIVFKLEFIKKPILTIMIVISLFINIYAVAFVLIINTLFEVIINGIAVERIIGYKLSVKIIDWIKNVFPAILMFCVVYLLNFVNINKVALLVIQIFVGVMFYVLFSIFTKNKNFISLRSVLVNKLNKGNN